MKKAILAVSYGTTYPDALRDSVEAVENAFRESFPDYTVYRAFTGKKTMEMLEEKHMHVDSVEQALEKLAVDGYEEVIIQPTHVIGGSEFESVCSTAKAYENRFSTVKIGAPLLQKPEDIETLCRFFAEKYLNLADAVVLMGHGSDHHANKLYTDFGDTCRRLGYCSLFIATLEAKPSIDDIIPQLKDGGYKNIIITPLLFVAGGHACKDMAGDGENSWKSRLEAEGFTVNAIVKGLGEYSEIRQLYVKHLYEASIL